MLLGEEIDLLWLIVSVNECTRERKINISILRNVYASTTKTVL